MTCPLKMFHSISIMCAQMLWYTKQVSKGQFYEIYIPQASRYLVITLLQMFHSVSEK